MEKCLDESRVVLAYPRAISGKSFYKRSFRVCLQAVSGTPCAFIRVVHSHLTRTHTHTLSHSLLSDQQCTLWSEGTPAYFMTTFQQKCFWLWTRRFLSLPASDVYDEKGKWGATGPQGDFPPSYGHEKLLHLSITEVCPSFIPPSIQPTLAKYCRLSKHSLCILLTTLAVTSSFPSTAQSWLNYCNHVNGSTLPLVSVKCSFLLPDLFYTFIVVYIWQYIYIWQLVLKPLGQSCTPKFGPQTARMCSCKRRLLGSGFHAFRVDCRSCLVYPKASYSSEVTHAIFNLMRL